MSRTNCLQSLYEGCPGPATCDRRCHSAVAAESDTQRKNDINARMASHMATAPRLINLAVFVALAAAIALTALAGGYGAGRIAKQGATNISNWSDANEPA